MRPIVRSVLAALPPPRALVAAAVGAVATLALGVRPVAAQGISYEISPTIVQLRWNEVLGIQRDYLYGGRVGFNFGQLLGLQGYYLTRSGLQTNPAVLEPATGFDPAAPGPELDVRSVGADLVLNLGTGATVPFVRAGGGVLRLDPEGMDRTDQILLKAGGGVRFGVSGGLSGELFAEDWAFRLNRYRLFTPGAAPPDPEADELRHNLALGAAITLPLGGDPTDPGPGIRGAAIPVEPFAGQLRFDDELGLEDQELIGIRTGLDINRFIGVRGFYWRGVTPQFNDTEEVQSYGGEVQFNLGAGPGISPFLVAGAGQLDFRDGFVDPQGVAREDRTALILGGGAGIALSPRVRLNVGVRDYIMSETDEPEDARRTDQLFHNPLLSAGLGFALGGRGPIEPRLREDRARLREETERLQQENERLRRQQEQRAERLEQLREENERLRRMDRRDMQRDEDVEARDMQMDEDIEARIDAVRGDTVRVRRQVVRERIVDGNRERTVTIPVPERGELYIRYGEPGGVRLEARDAEGRMVAPATPAPAVDTRGLSPAEMREVIREVIRDEMQREGQRRGAAPPPAAPQAATPQAAAPQGAQLTEERLQLMEARLAQRIDEIVARRLDERERMRGRDTPPTTVIVPREREREVVVVPPEPRGAEPTPHVTVIGERHRLRPQHTRLYTGLGLSDQTQILLGGRVNLGPMSPRSPVNVVPEIALGFGGGERSLLLAGNLQYDFGPIGGRTAIMPYATAGLGILSADGLRPVVNVGYGASALVGTVGTGPVRAFLEHQGVALYNRHRILLGGQFNF